MNQEIDFNSNSTSASEINQQPLPTTHLPTLSPQNSKSEPNSTTKPPKTANESDVLLRSVFVKNVDYSASIPDVTAHFQDCGEINRVKIPKDKLTQKPKGFAYIEFQTVEGAQRAKLLSDTLFKGRQITVMPKRKNVPGMGRGNSNQMGLGLMGQMIGAALQQSSMMAIGPALMGMMSQGGFMGRGRGGNFNRGSKRFRPY